MGTREAAKRDAGRTVGTSVVARTPLGRASVPVSARRVMLALAGLVVAVMSVGGPHVSAPASAAAERASVDPAPTPSAEPTPSAPPSAPQPAAPAITSPPDGSAVTTARTVVSGTKPADSGVRLETSDGTRLCVVDAGPDTSFSCGGLTLPIGGDVALRAVGTLADGSAAGVVTTIHITSVPPPVVSSNGSRPVNGLIRGSGIPGAVVSVISSSGESCSLTADAGGAWACLLTGSAPDGAYSLTATQEAPFAPGVHSDASAPMRVVLDRTAPAPPVVTAPTAGSTLPDRDVRFAGTGEDGSTVTVFVGSASVCQAIVSAARWSCVATALATGDARVVAIQKDAAGNSSSGSDAVALVVAAPPGSPTPSPTAPTRTLPSTPGAAPSPDVPDAPDDLDEGASPASPPDPGVPRPTPPAPPENDAWDATTPFSTPLSSLLASSPGIGGLRAIVLAVLIATTIALGALLHLRGTSAAPVGAPARRVVLTGRNRATAPIARSDGAAESPTSASATTVLFALVAVAGILILSRPVDGTPAYARLLFASVTATAVVALVSVVVPALVARWLGGGRLHIAVDARGFLIVAGTAAASRIFDLDPPALFALVVTASTAAAVGRATEGRVAAARIVGLTLLGVFGWGAGILLAPALQPGFASSLVVETLNVLTAAALGSATIMLIPLGTSTGRSLWAASRIGWLALAVLVVALEISLLGSRSPEAADAVAAIGVTGVVGCCALFLSVWIWRRVVAPELTRED
ncbi:hypothetical protein ELQ92_07865 [Labedella populi]|uniref:Uncharacterized protein n=1 Tax=Labedella populi TaxID=2498850 RepID=A0A444QD90_9MICO|nr:hypothetical protein [Labedella populi]RWZ64649.1 hypothetical protein ELQ92_07865 [Labedella populi]